MAAPIATSPQQSAAIDRLLNDMDLRGLTSVEIAQELAQRDPPIVMTDSAVRKRIQKLNKATRAKRDAQIVQELRSLAWVQQEAMDAWHEKPDAAYLDKVLRASESRRKLIGLDAPAKSELSGPNGAPLAVTTQQQSAAAEELARWRQQQQQQIAAQSNTSNASATPATSPTPTAS